MTWSLVRVSDQSGRSERISIDKDEFIVGRGTWCADGGCKLCKERLGQYISRSQAKLRPPGNSSEADIAAAKTLVIEATGSNPTGVKRANEQNWTWLARGQVLAVCSGDEISLDKQCKDDCRCRWFTLLQCSQQSSIPGTVNATEEWCLAAVAAAQLKRPMDAIEPSEEPHVSKRVRSPTAVGGFSVVQPSSETATDASGGQLTCRREGEQQMQVANLKQKLGRLEGASKLTVVARLPPNTFISF